MESCSQIYIWLDAIYRDVETNMEFYPVLTTTGYLSLTPRS